MFEVEDWQVSDVVNSYAAQIGGLLECGRFPGHIC